MTHKGTGDIRMASAATTPSDTPFEERPVIRTATTITGNKFADQVDAYKDYIGKNVYIQTITLFFTGKLMSIEAGFFVIQDAAWIAATGRVATALVEGNSALGEVEPYPDGLEVRVSIDATVVFFQWLHPLPREQK